MRAENPQAHVTGPEAQKFLNGVRVIGRGHFWVSDPLGRGTLRLWFAREATGISTSTNEFVEREYERLRAIAARHLRNENTSQNMLHPTALVHEAYLRVLQMDRDWNDRRHFLATAALTMGHVLIDAARRRNAGKRRPLGTRVSLSALDQEPSEHLVDVLALSEALARMQQHDPLQFQVTSLYFFAGLSANEIAGELQLTERQVRNELSHAKAYLLQRMEAGE